MRMDLFKQYQRLSFSYYDRNNTGDDEQAGHRPVRHIGARATRPGEPVHLHPQDRGLFALLFFINVPLTAIMLAATLLGGVPVLAQLLEATIFTENRRRWPISTRACRTRLAASAW